MYIWAYMRNIICHDAIFTTPPEEFYSCKILMCFDKTRFKVAGVFIHRSGCVALVIHAKIFVAGCKAAETIHHSGHGVTLIDNYDDILFQTCGW